MGGGRGRGLAVLVELHVTVLLAVAADTAVALRVDEGAGVTERAPLKLPLAQFDGAAAHAQDKTLAVVIQAIGTSTQGVIDVGEGHAGGHPLLSNSHGSTGWASNYIRSLAVGQGGGGVVLIEGVDTVVAIGGVLSCEKHAEEGRKI